jgi:hypothetical protein
LEDERDHLLRLLDAPSPPPAGHLYVQPTAAELEAVETAIERATARLRELLDDGPTGSYDATKPGTELAGAARRRSERARSQAPSLSPRSGAAVRNPRVDDLPARFDAPTEE